MSLDCRRIGPSSVFTEDKAERCLVRKSVGLSVVRIRKRLYEGIPVLLMYGNVVSEVQEDGLMKSLSLDVSSVNDTLFSSTF